MEVWEQKGFDIDDKFTIAVTRNDCGYIVDVWHKDDVLIETITIWNDDLEADND